MPITPEQEMLKQAAERMLVCKSVIEARNHEVRYRSLANPAAILDIFAQLEGCNEDYGQAVDSVAQLQDEVLEVRAQLEAAQAAASEPEECSACKGGDNCRFPLCRDADEQQQIAGDVAVELIGVPAQTGTLICKTCGVDRAKVHCHNIADCGMAGVAYTDAGKESAIQSLADQGQELPKPLMTYEAFMDEAKRTGLTLDALMPGVAVRLAEMEAQGVIRKHEDGGHEYVASPGDPSQ